MTDEIYMFLAATAILSGSLGVCFGAVIGYASGKSDGQKDGEADGFRRGWIAYRDTLADEALNEIIRTQTEEA